MADPQNSPQITPELLQQLGLGQVSSMPTFPTGAPSGPPTPIGSPIISGTDPISQQMIETTQKGLQYLGQTEATRQAQQQALAQAIQQQQTVGPRSFQPTFKGRSPLGKIGEALLTVGASTRPGQSIEDVVYAKPREEYARKAAEIASLQKSLEGTTQALGAEAGLTSKPIGALGTAARGFGVEESAQARMQQVQNQLQIAMRGLNIREVLVGAQKGELQAKAALERALPDIYRQRIQLGYDTNTVKEDIVNTLSQEGVMDKFQLSTLVDSILGTQLAPQAPTTPRGSQPAGGAKPMPQRGARGGGPSIGTVEDGHRFKGGDPANPANWEPVGRTKK